MACADDMLAILDVAAAVARRLDLLIHNAGTVVERNFVTYIDVREWLERSAPST